MTPSQNPHAEPEFSKLRAAIWPIQRSELKKFIPMGMMMFFILFIYTIVRDIKDTQVVSESGAEAINFLKFWGVMPSSIVFVILYAKLSNVLSREKLFYACIIPFIAFFGSFALLIYPNRSFLHPAPETVAHLQHSIPQLRFIFSLWGSWSYSIFYIAAELFGSVALTLLFWQFANQITRVHEAKRFYALFPLCGNIALILSGQTLNYFSHYGDGKNEAESWGVSLDYMMGAVVICGVMIVAIYRWMNQRVLTDPQQYDAADTEASGKIAKPKLSIRESIGYLFSSKYLGYIALLVLCYGVCINLVEVTWKSQLSAQYPDKNDYAAFMGNFSTVTGISTMTLILLSKGVIRRFGWLAGAIATPIIIFITGTLFYALVIFHSELNWLTVAMGATPLFLAVMIGAAQNVLSKGTKYSLFDPTTQMAYIPLDQELKVKGKAAVDVVGGRLGKSGGAMVQQILLVATSASATQISIAPYNFTLLLVMLGVWMIAARGLSKLYQEKVDEHEREANDGPITASARPTVLVETSDQETILIK